MKSNRFRFQLASLTLLLLIVVITITVLAMSNSVGASSNNQVSPPIDENNALWRNDIWANSTLQHVTFLYSNAGTIMYERQSSLGVVLESRIATAQEQTVYYENLDNSLVIEALNNITGSIGGEPNYKTWVDNRTLELQSCEDDMSTGQGLLFNNLGANGQNQTITRMQECIKTNSRVHRIVISNLYDLLVTEGLISPSNE